MNTPVRRRIDLCTCGHSRESHNRFTDGSSICRREPLCTCRGFMPNPQPAPVTPSPLPFSRITAFWNGSAWTARVQRLEAPIGHGQAATWIDAVNAAIEDLQEKKP